MDKEKMSRWLKGEISPLDESMIKDLSHPNNKPEEDPFLEPHKLEVRTYKRFSRWMHRSGGVHFQHAYLVVAIVLTFVLIGVLIAVSLDLPCFGNAVSLTDDELSTYYVEEGLHHTGAPNIVSGIIMEFRGFDTLGESHVLFIAVSMVIMLLYVPPTERIIAKADTVERHFEPTHDEVLRHGAKLLVPFIVVFAINILLNGHISPGGGFSGGAILGAAFMIMLEAFGPAPLDRYISFKVLRRLMTCALSFYAISKGYVFMTGANGIPNGIGTGTFGRLFSGGLLLPLNVAVGMVVACTMSVMYALLRRKGEL